MSPRSGSPAGTTAPGVANRRTRVILVTGISGQLGHELMSTLQGLGDVVGLDRAALDLGDPDAIRRVVRSESPSLIVNPAAYTAVDRAEREPEPASRINARAPGILAEEAQRLGIPLIHFSTDYVYAGDKEDVYVESDPTDPQNVYGRSKLAGETAIAAAGCRHLIFRTSWVYGANGANFVKMMLRLGAEKNAVRVVGDQFGAPTWARTIADVTAQIVAQSVSPAVAPEAWWAQRSGVYHLSCDGVTNWAAFAAEIFAHTQCACRVEPIASADYPTPARRPANSRMSNAKLMETFSLHLPDWRAALHLYLDGRKA
ncbi:dTDP-4-dehydrorhamnose reductase [Robbsia sp. Bb-Pol-6]|uniref:dTDP-4-dehydrorhamnose reductase n=1 Tax=Robbsia betulipollinis TaxID=2981849 RepID=A0ABT3ZML8_9BURK|nr:dTDP-4-dehydrorhamnose reductase [Robbsia betulipollinis]MCY0387572.1 dTDP-4-dehydrorhamnose reductase [Robbsia betulipollinis]